MNLLHFLIKFDLLNTVTLEVTHCERHAAFLDMHIIEAFKIFSYELMKYHTRHPFEVSRLKVIQLNKRETLNP